MPFVPADEPLLDLDEHQQEPSPLQVGEPVSATLAEWRKRKAKGKKAKKLAKANEPIVDDDPPAVADPMIDFEDTPPGSLPKDTALDLEYESFPVQSLSPRRMPREHEDVTPESLMLHIDDPIGEIQPPESDHEKAPMHAIPTAGKTTLEPTTSPIHNAAFEEYPTPRRPSVTIAVQQPESLARPDRPPPKKRVSSDNSSSLGLPIPYARQPPSIGQPRNYFQSMIMHGSDEARSREKARVAGIDEYCCVFDSFSDAADKGSLKRGRDALIVGSEGGLDVYRVLLNRIEVAGHLEGLRGSVIGAKVLPHSDLTDDLQMLRPLIAVIVHGPVSGNKPNHDQSGTNKSEGEVHYQTTVEVYSLRKQEHVATLIATQIVSVKPPAIGQASTLPGPIGDLRLDAKGRFATISSGKSGEVFVFSNTPNDMHDAPQFRCIGKYWTTLQTPVDPPNPSSSRDGLHHIDEISDRVRAPIMSLSTRWLALVSPATSQRTSILARPLLSEKSVIPAGLNNHTPPTPPPLTCDVVGVGEEGAWGRLTRQAAQGIVKYSQKGIELGWQGWRELTNPTTPSGQQAEHSRTPSTEHDQFPPTNAPLDEPGRIGHEPAIVTIVDMQALLEAEELKAKHAPPPLAAFALTEGCNYLSFSTSGLRLLTVSRRGEMSTVWDLTQARHGTTRRRGAHDSSSSGPCVKQVLRIPRSSQSVVVDVNWSSGDDMIALLTTHGTVHLHEIPARASTPKRTRRTTNDNTSERPSEIIGVPTGLSPPSANGLLGSLRTGWQQVSSGVGAIRTNNNGNTFGLPTTFAGFKEATAIAGHAGGRLVARGLHQGYTAAKGGASDYWHADDNKIRLKALAENSHPGTLRWMSRQSDVFLGIVCGGVVHLYNIARTMRQKGDDLVTGLKHEKGTKHFTLPPIVTKDDGRNSDGRQCIDTGPHGYWTLHYRDDPHETPRHRTTQDRYGPSHAPLLTDVETNPPYCPFHVDSRLSIFTFDGDTAQSAFLLPDSHDSRATRTARRSNRNNDDHDDENYDKWVFGGPLPPSTKVNSHDEDFLHDDRLRSGTGREIGDSDDDDDMAAQVESRLTMRTTISDSEEGAAEGESRRSGGGGGVGSGNNNQQEIHIHTRPMGRALYDRRNKDVDGDDEDDFAERLEFE